VLSVFNKPGALPFHLLCTHPCFSRRHDLDVKFMLDEWFKGQSLPALKDNTPAFICAQTHNADAGIMNLLIGRSPDLFKRWDGYKPEEKK